MLTKDEQYALKVGDVVEARDWARWEKPYPTVRGAIVRTFPGHVDIDVAYTSHDVTFYPGESRFWDGNICRVQRRHVERTLSYLHALGAVSP